jgi:hypothetical protein
MYREAQLVRGRTLSSVEAGQNYPERRVSTYRRVQNSGVACENHGVYRGFSQLFQSCVLHGEIYIGRKRWKERCL